MLFTEIVIGLGRSKPSRVRGARDGEASLRARGGEGDSGEERAWGGEAAEQRSEGAGTAGRLGNMPAA